jgi:Xaa-Pro aminopeptidase
MKNLYIKNIIENNNLDALLLFSNQNRFWFTGFSSSVGYLIITKDNSNLFLDNRYYQEAKQLLKNNIIIYLLKNLNDIYSFLVENKIKKIGFEKQYLTFFQFENFQKWLNFDWIGIDVENLRIIKTKNEISMIKKACEISINALDKVKKKLKYGMSEIEIKNLLLLEIFSFGGEKQAFDFIVAFGEKTAYPHAKVSKNKLIQGQIITVDFGAIYNGYRSDITRTFFLKNDINLPENQELKKILQLVKNAQLKGISIIKPKIKAQEVDAACRDYIKKAGYGDYFIHGTGHGLGIEIHESPYLNDKNDLILEEGMVITVEPGIYVPGLGGARIEDDVLITKNGFEILSKININHDRS